MYQISISLLDEIIEVAHLVIHENKHSHHQLSNIQTNMATSYLNESIKTLKQEGKSEYHHDLFWAMYHQLVAMMRRLVDINCEFERTMSLSLDGETSGGILYEFK